MHEKPKKSIVKDFNHYFGPKYVYMVDGQAAMTNPNDEFGRLINFFGFESDIIHFELNKEKLDSDTPTNQLAFKTILSSFQKSKEFNCLNKPVNFCLGDNKGTSRKEHVDLFRSVLELIFNSCVIFFRFCEKIRVVCFSSHFIFEINVG